MSLKIFIVLHITQLLNASLSLRDSGASVTRALHLNYGHFRNILKNRNHILQRLMLGARKMAVICVGEQQMTRIYTFFYIKIKCYLENRKFSRYYIFANSVKRHICDPQSCRQGMIYMYQ